MGKNEKKIFENIEKTSRVSMERSDRHYGEEKKLIEEMAEEIENCYGRETKLSERAREYLLKTDCSGGWIACEDRLPEELRHCLEGDGCGDCAYHEPETKLTCGGLLQKAYEVVKEMEDRKNGEIDNRVLR